MTPPLSDLDARTRIIKAGLYHTLQMLGRTLADVEADPTPGLSIEESILPEDIIDLLAICRHLMERLIVLEHEEAAHAAALSASRLN